MMGKLIPSALLAFYLAAICVACLKGAKAPWPDWWYRQAICIHLHESVDWHKTTDWQGYPSYDHGGMQIDMRTWARMAPSGFPSDPANASVPQQLLVAYRIWQINGHRWGGQWPNSSVACGLA